MIIRLCINSCSKNHQSMKWWNWQKIPFLSQVMMPPGRGFVEDNAAFGRQQSETGMEWCRMTWHISKIKLYDRPQPVIVWEKCMYLALQVFRTRIFFRHAMFATKKTAGCLVGTIPWRGRGGVDPAIWMGNEVLGYNETSETSQAGGFQVKSFALKPWSFWHLDFQGWGLRSNLKW